MKKKTTIAGSSSANPTALLLPMDADGFTNVLESIAGESPEDFASKQSARRIESAHRIAWCEVTEAMEKAKPSDLADPAQLAEVSAQRKLTAILDGLTPAIALRNQKAAAAAEQTELLCHVKEDAEAVETEVATLKARDCRIDWRGDTPDTGHLTGELSRLQYYLDHGSWRFSDRDSRDDEFEEGLLKLIEKGIYTGKPNKKAVEKRIADLSAQIEEVESKLRQRLNGEDILRLGELETKLPSIRAEITDAEQKASPIVADAEIANLELKAKVEAVAIIARAIIQACHIECGITTAAA